MKTWLLTEIEDLARRSKELASIYVRRKYDREKAEHVNELELRCDLRSFTSEEVQEIRTELQEAVEKVARRRVQKYKAKMLRRIRRI